MATSFTEVSGMWTFYAKVRLKTGFKHQRPARLWNSKEDAERDVKLFIWYSSIRDVGDPHIPHPRGSWFKTMLPDASWDHIRDFLNDRGDIQYPNKKRKFSSIAVSDDIKRKHRAEAEAKKKRLEAEVALPLPNKVPVMRKKFSELSVRKQKDVRNSMKKKMEKEWALISPTYPEELGNCMQEINFITEKSSENEAFANAYKLASEKKDEEKKTVLLSNFILQKNMSKVKLSKIVGMEVSSRKYTSAKYHAMLYGPGQSAEVIVHKRGAAVKRAIVKRFVEFLMECGVKTANGRTVYIPGKEGVSVPNIKRLEGKHPLIRAFEDRERRVRSIMDQSSVEGSRGWISLRRQSMEEIIAVTCPEKHASLAALDVVGQLHGVINFTVLRKKLRVLSSIFEEIQDKVDHVLEELKEVQETLANRNKFRSEEHFCTTVNNNSGPACHCHHYAFGKLDPIVMLPREDDTVKMARDHYHKGGRKMCDQIDGFPGLLDALEVDASESVKTKLVEFNIKYHKQRYIHYKGHQARLAHEGECILDAEHNNDDEDIED